MPADSAAIDALLAQRLIASQFPAWAGLPVEPVLPGGWDNRTFRLGSSMAVRMPSAAHYAKAVDIEQSWLPRLAPHLPLPIPQPVARGKPEHGYPWPWSVYGWLDGEPATAERAGDLDQLALDLAHFLAALQSIDAAGGPTRTMRGGSLERWDEQARQAIEQMRDRVDPDLATRIWEDALRAPFTADPVWFHGDVAAGNLLVREGQLSAVIDFGGLGVGDPACDTSIAWTLFSAPSRQRFRDALQVDDAVWARGRGWALWKAMIVLAGIIDTNVLERASSQHALDQVLYDYQHDN